jgi:hypothetical protein
LLPMDYDETALFLMPLTPIPVDSLQ